MTKILYSSQFEKSFRKIPENIAQLFTKFKQFSVAMSSTDKKGTGLGLVVVKGIIDAHGGAVGVASKEGSGSTFYFTLPL